MGWSLGCLAVGLLLLSTVSAGDDDDYIYYDGSSSFARMRTPPPYLKVCQRSSQQLNKCIKSSLDNLITHITHGSKELGLPEVDPLIVPLLEITEGGGNVSMEILFKNMQIHGLGNLRIINVRSNLEDLKFEITMKTPYLDLMGPFSAQGGVLSFPITGSGDFSLNLTDVSAAWILYLAESEEVHGHKYLMIDHLDLDIIPADISAKFGDTIDGDNKLGSAINLFFNENAHEIFKTVKPKISESLNNILGHLANQVLSRYPAEVLLPP